MLASSFKPCVLIPCFNHGKFLSGTLESLEYLNLPCLVVDDGSTDGSAQLISKLPERFSWVQILLRSKNGGKGKAIKDGVDELTKQGFTHVLQVDADGQHDSSVAPLFLKLGKENPNDLISGLPVYDESVPKSRKYGRKITQFWVALETRSLSIKDSMCGFRLYNLRTLKQLFNSETVGLGMDFDIEVLVRLYWRGVNFRYIPIKVTYSSGGVSHFEPLRDNWKISKMHTRLFLESLVRTRKQDALPSHWARIQERKGFLGFRFLLWVYKNTGRKVFHAFLAPVASVFWLTGSEQRKASQNFLKKVKEQRDSRDLPTVSLSSFRHFLSFGDAILDRLSAWAETWEMGRDFEFADEQSEKLMKSEKGQKGKLLLVSHLGMVEAGRAIAQKEKRAVVNALVFLDNSPRVTTLMEQMNENSSDRLIPVTEIDMATVMLLEEKISRGEWVAIAADRVPVSGDKGRTVRVNFLGEKASFPIGPFVLASLLGCEVEVVFAIRRGPKMIFEVKHFADRVSIPRSQRKQALEKYVSQYAAMLEDEAIRYPLSWFNFYDFWRQD